MSPESFPRLIGEPSEIGKKLETEPSLEKKEAKPFKLEMVSFTEASKKHAERDEACQDSVGIWPEFGLLALADGMGGYSKGDIISQTAIAAINEVVENLKKGGSATVYKNELTTETIFFPKNPTPEEADVFLNSLFLQAGLKCFKKSNLEMDIEGERPSTTFILGLIMETNIGPRWFVKSVGDSKVFLRKATSQTIPVNHNFNLPADSVLELLVNSEGKILSRQEAEWIDQAESQRGFLDKLVQADYCSQAESEEIEKMVDGYEVLAKINSITEPKKRRPYELWFEMNVYFNKFKMVRKRNRRMISQSLSSVLEDLKIHSATEDGIPGIKIKPGDKGFFVSDGIADPLSDRQIGEALANEDTLFGHGQKLMESAKINGDDLTNWRKKNDDRSVVGVELVGFEKKEIIVLEPSTFDSSPKIIQPEIPVAPSFQPAGETEAELEFLFFQGQELKLSSPHSGKWKITNRWVIGDEIKYELKKVNLFSILRPKKILLTEEELKALLRPES